MDGNKAYSAIASTCMYDGVDCGLRMDGDSTICGSGCVDHCIQRACCHPKCVWLLNSRTIECVISRQSTTEIVAGSRKMRGAVLIGTPRAAHISALIGPTCETSTML